MVRALKNGDDDRVAPSGNIGLLQRGKAVSTELMKSQGKNSVTALVTK